MSLKHPDSRFLAMQNWLQNVLNLEVHSLTPASSDASFRRYFRVHHSQGIHIVMDAPPEKENVAAFVHVDQLLAKQGLHVPQLFASDLENGYLLLEDLGNRNLLESLKASRVNRLYGKAMDELFQLQSMVELEHLGLNRYDQPLLLRELGIFYEWFLENLLGIELPNTLKNQINQSLIASALEQPQVFVHRDFHSRNLMLLADDSIGIIDFQDAVIGPISYDLVSLLRDCYVEWPQSQVEHWTLAYYHRLSDAEKLNVDYSQFRHWFDWMGLQRHLKAIGIFSRLHLRDGKSSYLADIPRTMNYVMTVTNNYPELTDFHQFLHQQVRPIYQDFL